MTKQYKSSTDKNKAKQSSERVSDTVVNNTGQWGQIHFFSFFSFPAARSTLNQQAEDSTGDVSLRYIRIQSNAASFSFLNRTFPSILFISISFWNIWFYLECNPWLFGTNWKEAENVQNLSNDQQIIDSHSISNTTKGSWRKQNRSRDARRQGSTRKRLLEHHINQTPELLRWKCTLDLILSYHVHEIDPPPSPPKRDHFQLIGGRKKPFHFTLTTATMASLSIEVRPDIKKMADWALSICQSKVWLVWFFEQFHHFVHPTTEQVDGKKEKKKKSDLHWPTAWRDTPEINNYYTTLLCNI